MKSSKDMIERVMAAVFLVCGVIAVAAVFAICVYMFVSGVPAITKIGITEMLFSTVWKPTAADPQFGILYIILTSVVGTMMAIIIGVPIAVLTAVFLAEIAPKRLTAIVNPAVELLAGIPSVVYGLLGILIIKPLMYRLEMVIFANSPDHQMTGGANLISAVFVLAVMILPTVVNVSRTSLKAVPAHPSLEWQPDRTTAPAQAPATPQGGLASPARAGAPASPEKAHRRHEQQNADPYRPVFRQKQIGQPAYRAQGA